MGLKGEPVSVQIIQNMAFGGMGKSSIWKYLVRYQVRLLGLREIAFVVVKMGWAFGLPVKLFS